MFYFSRFFKENSNKYKINVDMLLFKKKKILPKGGIAVT